MDLDGSTCLSIPDEDGRDDWFSLVDDEVTLAGGKSLGWFECDLGERSAVFDFTFGGAFCWDERADCRGLIFLRCRWGDALDARLRGRLGMGRSGSWVDDLMNCERRFWVSSLKPSRNEANKLSVEGDRSDMTVRACRHGEKLLAMRMLAR